MTNTNHSSKWSRPRYWIPKTSMESQKSSLLRWLLTSTETSLRLQKNQILNKWSRLPLMPTKKQTKLIYLQVIHLNLNLLSISLTSNTILWAIYRRLTRLLILLSSRFLRRSTNFKRMNSEEQTQSCNFWMKSLHFGKSKSKWVNKLLRCVTFEIESLITNPSNMIVITDPFLYYC